MIEHRCFALAKSKQTSSALILADSIYYPALVSYSRRNAVPSKGTSHALSICTSHNNYNYNYNYNYNFTFQQKKHQLSTYLAYHLKSLYVHFSVTLGVYLLFFFTGNLLSIFPLLCNTLI